LNVSGSWRPAPRVLACVLPLLAMLPPSRAESPDISPPVSGEVALSAGPLPFSRYASIESLHQFLSLGASGTPPAGSSIEDSRRFYDRMNSGRVERLRELFPVQVETAVIAGVPVDIVVPVGGVPSRHRDRVLINLHGGAFLWGAHSGGLVESIPIASLGELKVISVNYREGPEYTFPAASEDVAAVYSALLKSHRPRDVGIYGTSAGGVLTAESMAWIAAHGIPTPGAIGMFCGSALEVDGDSAFLAQRLAGAASQSQPSRLIDLPYFKGADPNDPLVFPGNFNTMLARFPASLLISASRDFALSSVLRTRELLVQAGVSTELHVYEGMWHSFYVDPEMPESRATYEVIAQFFNRMLGHRPSAIQRESVQEVRETK
jgi:monoterpene epsilon-lactone hydrolase